MAMDLVLESILLGLQSQRHDSFKNDSMAASFALYADYHRLDTWDLSDLLAENPKGI